MLKAYVEDGIIKRLDTDDRLSSENDPQLRACMRCRAYLGRLYHPGRLMFPLKQTKQRGQLDGFVRIGWPEAIDTIGTELKRIKATHGNESIFIPYATGAMGRLHGQAPLYNLMGRFGGFLGIEGNYCSLQHDYVSSFVLGSPLLHATPDSLTHSKLIILWGSNFADTIMGTNTPWYVTQAKEAGARIVYIGPHQNDTCASYADQWIPIIPGTDAALMLAMIYTMIEEALLDPEYINRFVHGFYDNPPNDVPAGSSLSAYVMGDDVRLVTAGLNQATSIYSNTGDQARYPYKAHAKTPKTPEWAQEITGVPQETIRQLAREYADISNPAYLHCSTGLQRRKEGCQPMILMVALAGVTGQWGKPGTGTGVYFGFGKARSNVGRFTDFPNPIKKSIPPMLWTDAARNPGLSEWGSGSVNNLEAGIKLVMNLAGNCLLNQHMDTNKTASLLGDIKKIEFICTIDNFMSSSARYSDIVLPGATNWEQNDIFTSWIKEDAALFSNKVVDPPGEAKTTYEIVTLIADKLGLKQAFTEGKSEEDWLKSIWKSSFEPISYSELKEKGVHVFNRDIGPVVGGSNIRENNAIDSSFRFNTETGKIELYSRAMVSEYTNRGGGQKNLDDDGDPVVYPIPMYFPEWGIADGFLTSQYPLKVVAPHTKWGTHSTHHNNPYLRELFVRNADGNPAYDADSYGIDPLDKNANGSLQEVLMNAQDAENRGIAHGDKVTVFNDRGMISASATVTNRLMPGVIILHQGAWWEPDSRGLDKGGCANTLSNETPSRICHGNAQNTLLAEVEKA